MFALRFFALASGLYVLTKALLILSHLYSHIMMLATLGSFPALFSLVMAPQVLGAISAVALMILGFKLLGMSTAVTPDAMAAQAVSILKVYLPAYLMLSGASALVSSASMLLHAATLSVEVLAEALFGTTRIMAGCGLFTFSRQHIGIQPGEGHPNEDNALAHFVDGLHFQA